MTPTTTDRTEASASRDATRLYPTKNDLPEAARL